MKDISGDKTVSKTLSVGTPYYVAPEIIKGKQFE
jgi:serine/threonine protein kinase